jgi:hypothetical protein
MLIALGHRTYTAIGNSCIEPPDFLPNHFAGAPFVLHEEHQEFGWLGAACVPTDDMHLVGTVVLVNSDLIDGLMNCLPFIGCRSDPCLRLL